MKETRESLSKTEATDPSAVAHSGGLSEAPRSRTHGLQEPPVTWLSMWESGAASWKRPPSPSPHAPGCAPQVLGWDSEVGPAEEVFTLKDQARAPPTSALTQGGIVDTGWRPLSTSMSPLKAQDFKELRGFAPPAVLAEGDPLLFKSQAYSRQS